MKIIGFVLFLISTCAWANRGPAVDPFFEIGRDEPKAVNEKVVKDNGYDFSQAEKNEVQASSATKKETQNSTNDILLVSLFLLPLFAYSLIVFVDREMRKSKAKVASSEQNVVPLPERKSKDDDWDDIKKAG